MLLCFRALDQMPNVWGVSLIRWHPDESTGDVFNYNMSTFGWLWYKSKEEEKFYRQIRKHRGKFCTWGGFRRCIYMQLFPRTIVNLMYVIHWQECSGRFATFTSELWRRIVSRKLKHIRQKDNCKRNSECVNRSLEENEQRLERRQLRGVCTYKR